MPEGLSVHRTVLDVPEGDVAVYHFVDDNVLELFLPEIEQAADFQDVIAVTDYIAIPVPDDFVLHLPDEGPGLAQYDAYRRQYSVEHQIIELLEGESDKIHSSNHNGANFEILFDGYNPNAGE